MIIEGLKFVLGGIIRVVYPYPELIDSGWYHTTATIFMVLLYFMYFLIFGALNQAYQEGGIKD